MMLLARCAYSSVWSVSSAECAAGDTVAMMHVLLLPPSASRRSRVSFESRYGTWPPPATKAAMTRPNVRSDLLISPASLARLSTAPDREMFSDPARSTRLSLPHRMTSSPSGVDSLVCTVTLKTECDLLDCLFISVSAVRRFALPRLMWSKISSGLATATSSSPFTATPPFPSSIKGCFGALALAASTVPSTRSDTASRSVISSL